MSPFTNPPENVITTLVFGLGAVLYGAFCGKMVIFLFNNLPDRFFKNPLAHIGKGGERHPRIQSGYGQYLLIAALMMLNLVMVMQNYLYLPVGATVIWLLIMIFLGLWLYGDVPEWLPLGILICALATAPFHASMTDMILGGAIGGFGLGLGLWVVQRVTHRDNPVGAGMLIGAGMGLHLGIALTGGILLLCLAHTAYMEFALKVTAKSVGYVGLDQDTMKLLESKGKAPLLSPRWQMIHLGHSPLLMVYCRMCGYAMVIYPIVAEMSYGAFPWT